MVTAPPADGALDSTAANSSEEDRKRKGGVVGLVRPKTMVASGDTETSPEVIDDRPESSLPLQRCPEGSDTAGEGDTDDEDDLFAMSAITLRKARLLDRTYVEPVNVLVPVGLGDRCVGDVWLLGVVVGVAVGLAGRSHGRLLVDELRLDGEVASHSLGGGHDDGAKSSG